MASISLLTFRPTPKLTWHAHVFCCSLLCCMGVEEKLLEKLVMRCDLDWDLAGFFAFTLFCFFNCVVFFNCVGHLPSGSYLKSTLYYTLAAKPDSWVGLSPGMAVISPLSKQWCHCLWNLLIVFFLTIGALSFSHSAKLFDWNTIGSMKCSPPYTRNLISSAIRCESYWRSVRQLELMVYWACIIHEHPFSCWSLCGLNILLCREKNLFKSQKYQLTVEKLSFCSPREEVG